MASPLSALYLSACLGLLAAASAAGSVVPPDPSPVPVRQEPHHQLRLENAYLRVLDVHIAPGHPTLYHIHATPTVFVQLNDAFGSSQDWGRPRTASQHVAAGFSRFASYDPPLTHRAFNDGTTVAHTLAIELLRLPGPPSAGPALLAPGLTLAWERPQVRVYRVRLGPGERCAFPSAGLAHYLIAISGTLGTDTAGGASGPELRPEAHSFCLPGPAWRVHNVGPGAASGLLLELL